MASHTPMAAPAHDASHSLLAASASSVQVDVARWNTACDLVVKVVLGVHRGVTHAHTSSEHGATTGHCARACAHLDAARAAEVRTMLKKLCVAFGVGEAFAVVQTAQSYGTTQATGQRATVWRPVTAGAARHTARARHPTLVQWQNAAGPVQMRPVVPPPPPLQIETGDACDRSQCFNVLMHTLYIATAWFEVCAHAWPRARSSECYLDCILSGCKSDVHNHAVEAVTTLPACTDVFVWGDVLYAFGLVVTLVCHVLLGDTAAHNGARIDACVRHWNMYSTPVQHAWWRMEGSRDTRTHIVAAAVPFRDLPGAVKKKRQHMVVCHLGRLLVAEINTLAYMWSVANNKRRLRAECDRLRLKYADGAPIKRAEHEVGGGV